MRIDALTIAVTIFVVGLLIGGLGLTEAFEQADAPPAPHQRGFVVQR